MQKQIACLSKVAAALNAAGVSWALGAGMLLYCSGVVASSRDIDLLVAPEHAAEADAALRALGEVLPVQADAAYASRMFCRYVVDGVEVDMIAGLVVCYADEQYPYRFEPRHSRRWALEGETVHLSPLEDWYVLYQLMPGRAGRVAEVEAFLRIHGAQAELLRAWLDAPAPALIRARVMTLLRAL